MSENNQEVRESRLMRNDNLPLILALIYVISSLLDAVTTFVGVGMYGFYETNLVARMNFEAFGIVPALIVKAVATLIIGFIIYVYYKNVKSRVGRVGKIIVGIMVGLQVAVVVSNLVVLFF